MAKYPSLPLFTDAYMADTRHLTAAQHGAYLLMLMTAWRMPDCSLPDDDDFLARITCMDKRTWKKNKPTIMAFWSIDSEQRWCQGRLKDERNYVDQLRNKNVDAGRASALKRKERDSTTVTTKRQPKSNPHTHTHTLPIIDIDFEFFKDSWNATVISCPKVQSLTKQRKSAISARFDCELGKDTNNWIALLEKINSSDFLTGRNDKGFSATFDWVLKPSNLVKIIEGNYTNKSKPTKPTEQRTGAKTL